MRFLTKPLLTLVLALFAVGVSVYYFSLADLQKPQTTVVELETKSAQYEKREETNKAVHYKYRMQDEIDRTMDPQTKTVPKERLMAAQRVAYQLMNSESSARNEMNWDERGPNNLSGRTRAIMVDAADATGNTVIIGGVNGGIWRTTSFRATKPNWVKANDFFENLAVSSIIQDPKNPKIIYFGTGETFADGGNTGTAIGISGVQGLGIWKSIDGGLSYQHLSATSTSIFRLIQDLEIDKNGAIYASTATGGIQRSADGGTTWEEAHALSNADDKGSNIATDLEIATNGDLYAAFGQGGAGSIWKSDASQGDLLGKKGNWKNITPPQPGTYQRIELATAPSDAQVIYAVCQGGKSDDVESIFQSKNGGTTWISKVVPNTFDSYETETNKPTFKPFTTEQANYGLIAAVHPENADELYVGGLDVLRSKDGGTNWQQISGWIGDVPGIKAEELPPGQTFAQYVHADIHEIIFMPNASGKEVLIGCDGGIFHGTNLKDGDNLPIFAEKNAGYNTTQFYSIAVHPDEGSNYFIGGLQDIGGVQLTEEGFSKGKILSGGDGTFVFIDQKNPKHQLIGLTNTGLVQSLDGGQTFEDINLSIDGIGDLSQAGSFVNPSDYDHDTQIYYAYLQPGEIFAFKPFIPGSIATNTIKGLGGQVTHVKVDPSTKDRVWIASKASDDVNEMTVAYIEDASQDDPKVNKLTVPTNISSNSFISSISIDEKDPNHLIITVSNYGVISVWEVKNATSNNPSWANVEGNLPDMPVRWSMFMPGSSSEVLLATDLGVWKTIGLSGSQTKWTPTNSGLANTRVSMLQYRKSDGLIAAATFGRGLFTSGGKKTTTEPPTPVVTCAAIPQNLSLTASLGNGLSFSWDSALNATGYELSYRFNSSKEWTSVEVEDLEHKTGRLVFRGSSIIYRIRTICADEKSPWSSEQTYRIWPGFKIGLDNETLSNVNQITKVYPNPMINDFTIEYQALEVGIFAIMDASGKLVKTGVLASTSGAKVNQRVAVGNWAAGMYLLQVRIGQETFTQQLIKR